MARTQNLEIKRLVKLPDGTAKSVEHLTEYENKMITSAVLLVAAEAFGCGSKLRLKGGEANV